MPADPQRVRDVFLVAAERPEAERPAYLAEACGPDADLRAAVERLLAAHADKPSQRGAMLARRWTELKLDDVVRPSAPELLHLAGRLVGRSRKAPRDARAGRRGGIFDPSGVESIVSDAVPFESIADHIREGRLSALSISTTHVGNG